MRRSLAMTIAVVLLGTGAPWATPLMQPGPLLLSGALLVDGTGSPGRYADVVVSEGRIVQIGPARGLAVAGGRVIDLDGLILAPGFIDIHNHSAEALLASPDALTQISQGITTVIVGADGSSPLPIADYLHEIDAADLPLNVGTMVGHGSARAAVMGEDYARTATGPETESIARIVRQGLRDGAYGVSSGLEYDPGFYSDTAELIAAAREAAAHDALYMSHIRDEEEGLIAAVDEVIAIGRASGARVQISHIKAGNASVWGEAPRVLEHMQSARAAGVDIAADQYPYTAWQSSLSIVVPSRRFDDPAAVAAGIAAAGGADRLQIVDVPGSPELAGQRLDTIAEHWGIGPTAAYSRLLGLGRIPVIGHTMSEDDVVAFMRSPLVMTASDGGIGSAHPRGAGAFARVLAQFVRERAVISLPRAIARGSAQPAGRLGLADRGVIREGAVADLVAFDPALVDDRATFAAPQRVAVGVRFTWVAGQAVWRDGAPTGARPGRALRHR